MLVEGCPLELTGLRVDLAARSIEVVGDGVVCGVLTKDGQGERAVLRCLQQRSAQLDHGWCVGDVQGDWPHPSYHGAIVVTDHHPTGVGALFEVGVLNVHSLGIGAVAEIPGHGERLGARVVQVLQGELCGHGLRYVGGEPDIELWVPVDYRERSGGIPGATVHVRDQQRDDVLTGQREGHLELHPLGVITTVPVQVPPEGGEVIPGFVGARA